MGLISGTTWIYKIIIAEVITILLFSKYLKTEDTEGAEIIRNKVSFVSIWIGRILLCAYAVVALLPSIYESADIIVHDNTNKYVMFIYAVIVGPILEEILFRLIGFNLLREYKISVRIVFTALAFSLFHFSMNQTGHTFVVGLLFAYVYSRTKDIRYSIVLHMLNNLSNRVSQSFTFILLLLSLLTITVIVDTIKVYKVIFINRVTYIDVKSKVKLLMRCLLKDILPSISYMVLVTIIVNVIITMPKY